MAEIDDEEQAIVVDENDEVLGYRPTSKLTPKDRIRITVIWIEDGKGNALVHKRSAQKTTYPGIWENAAGGGVAHDETYEENAYKELVEEIGVSEVQLEFVTKNLFNSPTGERYCSWYKAVLDWPIEKFILEPEEVEEIKWINKRKLFDDRDKNPDKYMPSSKYWRELFG